MDHNWNSVFELHRRVVQISILPLLAFEKIHTHSNRDRRANTVDPSFNEAGILESKHTIMPKKCPCIDTTIASYSLRDQQRSAAKKLLQTFELIEQILLALPMLDILLAQSVSVQFKQIVERSIPLQQRIFLKPISDRGHTPLLNPIFNPASNEFRGNTLAVAGWTHDFTLANVPCFLVKPSQEVGEVSNSTDSSRASKATETSHTMNGLKGLEVLQAGRSKQNAEPVNGLSFDINAPRSPPFKHQAQSHAVEIELEPSRKATSSRADSEKLHWEGSWRRMSVTQPPLPIVCNAIDQVARAPMLGLAEEWYCFADLCADHAEM